MYVRLFIRFSRTRRISGLYSCFGALRPRVQVRFHGRQTVGLASHTAMTTLVDAMILPAR